MSKYKIKADGCDYGIYENGNLRLFVNSQANALLIKYILEQDSQHKVVIADLLEKINKKKRKLKIMTVKEWCDKTNCKKCEYCKDSAFCEYLQLNEIIIMKMSNTPYKTKAGKYILVEVRE